MQHLFYNLSNQGAEKELCRREKLQKELEFSCIAGSMCATARTLRICVCHRVFIFIFFYHFVGTTSNDFSHIFQPNIYLRYVDILTFFVFK